MCQPALRRFGLESTVRASLAFYNTEAEVHALGAALRNLLTPRRPEACATWSESPFGGR